MNNETLGGDAGLAIVNRAGFHGSRDRSFRISRRHDDERIAAAELEQGLLDLLAGNARDAAAGGFATGERHRRYARGFQDDLNLIGTNQKGLEQAFPKTRP